MKRVGLILVVGLAGLLLFASCSLIVVFGGAAGRASCVPSSTTTPVGPVVPGVPPVVGRWQGPQLQNAAAIVAAAHTLGAPTQAAAIAVMTAMDESSLMDLTYGDLAGPDSRGLFQQRSVGWGTLQQRLDPTHAATAFLEALLAVPNWQQLPPTLAAHAVQHNQDPYAYAPFWPDAVEVTGALLKLPSLTQQMPGTTAEATCGSGLLTGALPAVNGQGWVTPVVGPITSGFTLARIDPVTGVTGAHLGVDIGGSCRSAQGPGTPIRAAAAGRVIQAGPASGFGHWIVIDDGQGIVTVYGHMFADGLLVMAGQQVAAGQVIATVGSDGESTGCHLHFEIHVNGQPVDPMLALRSRGVTLGLAAPGPS